MLASGSLTTEEWLFLALVALYLGECLGRLRDGGWWFVSLVGEPARVLRAGLFSAAGQSGFVPLSPWPTGWSVRAEPWPFAVSPEGLVDQDVTALGPFGRSTRPPRVLPFSAVESLTTDGDRIEIDGSVLIVADTSFLAETLRRIASAPPTDRPRLIAEAIAVGTDLDAARARWGFARRSSRWPRATATATFLLLFVLGPAYHALRGFGASEPVPLTVFVVGLALAWIATVFGLARAHRALYPDEVKARRKFILMSSASPLAAMRGPDLLLRPSLARFHPLAVAGTVAGASTVRSLARDVILDLRHPLAAPEVSDEAITIERWFRAELTRSIEHLMSRLGLEPGELVSAPEPDDDQCRSYCPRCRQQFVHESGACPQCEGIALQAFSSSRYSQESAQGLSPSQTG